MPVYAAGNNPVNQKQKKGQVLSFALARLNCLLRKPVKAFAQPMGHNPPALRKAR